LQDNIYHFIKRSMHKFFPYNVLVCFLSGILTIAGCKKDPVIPTLTTNAVSNITINSVTTGGSVTKDGGKEVITYGVCWSNTDSPMVSDSHTIDGKGIGSFSSILTNLTPNTLYYVRAYATNSVGTAYGDVLSFTTTPIVVPTVTTTAISSITQTSAISGGNITLDGGGDITARGVCWSTTSNPTTANSKTADGTSAGIFASNLTELLPGTIYYVRAYAINSAGTAYGSELSFTSSPVTVPTLSTATISSITLTSAVSGGSIISNGGGAITKSGICWATSRNPDITNSFTTDGTMSGTYASNLSGLHPGVTYYVRAYATNSAGTGYGDELSFLTSPAQLPVLTTTPVTSIKSTTATSGGTITSDGGDVIVASGICWATTSNPTISGSNTTDGTTTGSFTSNLTGLTASTTYHVRAYATNSAGTAYGNDVSFSTITIPTLTTTPVTLITATSAISGGNITANGGDPVTISGICWATSTNPTIANSKTTDGTIIGSFTSSLTGLTQGTIYHVRAYATNGAGTAYGNDLSFTAFGVPVLTTTDVTSITATTAVSGGNISSNGGSAVTVSGICWATSLNPTISNSKTTNGALTGSYSGNMTGLIMGTTYHVRAYATNAAGTAYGNDVSFNTLGIPTISTTAVSSIAATTAVSGGNISANGGASISASGVCWSTSANPVITDSKTTDGSITGSFISNITGLTPGTTYHVRAYATNVVGTAYGSDASFTTITTPTISTSPISSITLTSALSGGNITTNGGATVTASGICWATTANPTTANFLTTDGSLTGIFSSNLSLLTPGTTYYVRAYATNIVGTSYGTQVVFNTKISDIEDNTYNTVNINGQVWMAENLKATKYLNSDLIGTKTGDVSSESTPKYQWAYGDDETNVPTYGRIYTWFAVTDSRGVCPTGWHVPTDTEWETLKSSLGDASTAGGKLKETGTIHWTSPNTGATNETGFTALPGGYRLLNGSYASINLTGYYWSSTPDGSNPAFGLGQGLHYNDAIILRGGYDKHEGAYIRCLKN
jgi:uncharacterized protein (TIGR02145 family)